MGILWHAALLYIFFMAGKVMLQTCVRVFFFVLGKPLSCEGLKPILPRFFSPRTSGYLKWRYWTWQGYFWGGFSLSLTCSLYRFSDSSMFGTWNVWWIVPRFHRWIVPRFHHFFCACSIRKSQTMAIQPQYLRAHWHWLGSWKHYSEPSCKLANHHGKSLSFPDKYHQAGEFSIPLWLS